MKECLAKLKTKSRNSTIQKCVTDEAGPVCCARARANSPKNITLGN